MNEVTPSGRCSERAMDLAERHSRPAPAGASHRHGSGRSWFRPPAGRGAGDRSRVFQPSDRTTRTQGRDRALPRPRPSGPPAGRLGPWLFYAGEGVLVRGTGPSRDPGEVWLGHRLHHPPGWSRVGGRGVRRRRDGLCGLSPRHDRRSRRSQPRRSGECSAWW